MTHTRKLAKMSAAAVLLSSGTSLAASDPASITLECNVAQLDTLCPALTQALEAKFSDLAQFSLTEQVGRADLAIQYVAKHLSTDWLSGQLTWQSADGRSGAGPVIEYSVMDRQLNPDDMTPFALQLVRATEFPKNLN